MNFFKCKNATLYIGNEQKCIKCKKTGEACICQRYCSEKKNYELTANSQNCAFNPINCEPNTPVAEPKKSTGKNFKFEKKPTIAEKTAEEVLDDLVVREPIEVDEEPTASADKEQSEAQVAEVEGVETETK